MTSSNGSKSEANGSAASANGATASSSDKAGNQQGDIDESLYSCQLYVLGHEAMRKMARP